jgi:hypothetical protein
MVGLKKLELYKFKDKETYETLRPVLNGWCFFRNENDIFYLKAPNNNTIKQFVELGYLIQI